MPASASSRKPQPSPGVAGISAYKVPRHPAPIDLKLDSNEGMEPDVGLLERLYAAGPDVMRRYPDATALQEALAARFDVPPARLIVTAGADDALDRICRAVLAPGRELLLTNPSFEMLPRYARLTGATAREFPWVDGPFPTAEFLGVLGDATALIAVVSPNNPTGTVATFDDVRRLSEAAPQAVVLLDHAYVEFADEDLTGRVLDLPNVVIVRTLSKAWGLAGLRTGYALGPEEVIGWMRAAGGPYAVSRPSIALAASRIEADRGETEAFIAQVRSERERLNKVFGEAGIARTDSQGNFVYTCGGDALWMRDALAGLGIAIRAYPGHPELGNSLRITCPGNEEQYQRLEAAFRAVLAPQALLFDMDGVLADVSGSYRRAIMETAAHFGADVTFEDIVAIKSEGNANDDWDVTHRLLARKGSNVPFADVKARFQELYLGKEGVPGFHEDERLLCSEDFLRSLAGRLPLAIVTGRPREDADRFLGTHAIGQYFRTAVVMEDGPLKPDPAPVRLALERLGVERAWMIGDTPDDLRAARGAGVVPLAVVAPGEQGDSSSTVLLRAGAARVLRQLEELTGYLP